MEKQDAAYWKERYEAKEQLIVQVMIDLDNYRLLVHNLKSEAKNLNTLLKYYEERAEKLEQSLQATLFEETTHEYYNRFVN